MTLALPPEGSKGQIRGVELLGRYSKSPSALDRLQKVRQRVAQGQLRNLSATKKPHHVHKLEHRLSPAEVEALIMRYRSGLGTRRLARESGLSRSGIVKLLRRHDAIRRRSPGQSDRGHY
jgi:hypothetical protein